MSARAGLITEKSFAIPTGAGAFLILRTWRDAAAETAGGKKLEGNSRLLVGKKKKKKKGQETQVGAIGFTLRSLK